MKIKRKCRWSRLVGYSTEGKAALFTLGLAYLYLIVEIVYKFKVEEVVCTWELLLLFILFAAFGLFKKLFSGKKAPVDFDGTPLPTADTDEAHARRESYYKKAGRLYGLVFAGVNFLALYVSGSVSHINLGEEFFEIKIPNILLALLASVLLYFISSYFAYMIDYLWYESHLAHMEDRPVLKEESSPLDAVAEPPASPVAEVPPATVSDEAAPVDEPQPVPAAKPKAKTGADTKPKRAGTTAGAKPKKASSSSDALSKKPKQTVKKASAEPKTQKAKDDPVGTP